MSERIDLDKLEAQCLRQRETGHPHDIGDADVLEPMIAAIRAAIVVVEAWSIPGIDASRRFYSGLEALENRVAPFRPDGE